MRPLVLAPVFASALPTRLQVAVARAVSIVTQHGPSILAEAAAGGVHQAGGTGLPLRQNL